MIATFPSGNTYDSQNSSNLAHVAIFIKNEYDSNKKIKFVWVLEQNCWSSDGKSKNKVATIRKLIVGDNNYKINAQNYYIVTY